MFGKRLKQLREAKHLSQEELADALSLSSSTIGMYEQGRREPDHEKLINIAEYLGTTTDYLLGHEPTITIQINEPEGLYSVSQVEIILDDAKDALAQAVKSGHITQEKAVEAVELARRQLMMIVDQNKK